MVGLSDFRRLRCYDVGMCKIERCLPIDDMPVKAIIRTILTD
jgi:hypothetical protein